MSEVQQKTGQRLILADGTTIENGTAGLSNGFLWCWFTGYTLQQAATLFFNPEKTSRIVFEFGEMSADYDGFTQCTNLSIDNDGEISVCLVRGAENA